MGKILYHGSDAMFSEFGKEYIGNGDGIDQYGSGIYFFDSPSKTIRYGELCYSVEYSGGKIMDYKKMHGFRFSGIVDRLILESPSLDIRLENHGDYDYYGWDVVFKKACSRYQDMNAMRMLNCIGNDFFDPDETWILLRKFVELTGYHGIVDKEYGIWNIFDVRELQILDVCNSEEICDLPYYK